MPSKRFNKICSICGEKAIGYNFCAISCESCKAFFRRNATKLDEYKCPFDEKCKITQVTRKFCRKCRLKKCYDVGMKQEWILNDEEKEIRKNKIEENRKWKQLGDHKSSEKVAKKSRKTDTISTTTITATADISDDNSVSISDDEIITNIMQIKNYLTPEDDSMSAESTATLVDTIDGIITIDGQSAAADADDIFDSTYQKAVELELAVLPIPVPINDYTTFSDVECNRMVELFSVQMTLNRPQPELKVWAQTIDEVGSFFVNKFELYIQRFVHTTKSLSAFQHLSQNDQIALVKYGSLETLFMRTAQNFDYQNEFWTFTLDNEKSLILKLELLKSIKRDVHTHFTCFLHKFGSEWDSDPFIIDLLTPIILFNPERPGVLDKESVKVEQQIYMYLLQRYLRLKYGSECETKAKFLRILNVLEYLRRLNESHILNYQEENPNDLGPLMREVFDIPNASNSLTAT